MIGIVASRLVERFNRPVVLIAGAGDEWKGSGRSISAFDLHGALAACSEHLERFGGHRAAAGLSIRPERSRPSRPPSRRTPTPRSPTTTSGRCTVVDAIVPAAALTLDLAQELDRLAPFGLGNPDVTLLVASCEAVDPATVGDGKHLRFRVRQHGRDAGSAIAFGLGAQLDRLRRGALRPRLPAEGEPLERHRRAAARRAAPVRRPDEYGELRDVAQGALAGGRVRLDAGGAADLRRARARRRGRPRRQRQLSSPRRFARCSPTLSNSAASRLGGTLACSVLADNADTVRISPRRSALRACPQACRCASTNQSCLSRCGSLR